MNFKVFVTLATIMFAYCKASTLPEAETVPKELDAETVPQIVESTTFPIPSPTNFPIPSPTTNQIVGTNIQQCEGNTNQEFGDASRVTCDLFASEPLCAAHCILLGNAGGYCNSQKVCVCRPRQKDEAEAVAVAAPCGGGCVTSSQCANYAGTTNCRCAWFGCNIYTAAADLTDVEQFELFLKAYSGNTVMLASAEKSYRKRQ